MDVYNIFTWNDQRENGKYRKNRHKLYFTVFFDKGIYTKVSEKENIAKPVSRVIPHYVTDVGYI
jgi:hypothetical protein